MRLPPVRPVARWRGAGDQGAGEARSHMKEYLLPPVFEAIRLAAHDWQIPRRIHQAFDEDWHRTQRMMNEDFPEDGYYLNRKRHRILRLPVIRHLRYLWLLNRVNQHAKDSGVNAGLREAVRARGVSLLMIGISMPCDVAGGERRQQMEGVCVSYAAAAAKLGRRRSQRLSPA
jgi:hypothetical protein